MILLTAFLFGNIKFHFIILGLIVILTFFIYFRSAILCNAADQVNNIILTGLLIHYLLLRTTSEPAIIYFFASLLLISYFSSGILKFHQEKWRNGYYLKQVVLTRNYNNPVLSNKIGTLNKVWFKYMSAIVIFWQVTCFLMPVLPYPIFYLYLLTSLSFHLVTGLLLRLNSFIWTFTGLLPCLVYVHEKIYPFL
jgi:hypothetical protein